MSSIMQILRRIGGTKAPPTSGSAGQLAMWKAGAAPTDAASLYAHDGTQWTEMLNTAGQWTVAGANVYRAAGNVGIGTPTPAGALDVVGPDDGAMFFRGTTGQLRIRPYVTSYKTTQISALNAAGTAYDPLAIGGSYTTIEANGVEKVRVATDGKVGIGITTPGVDLDVEGQAWFTGGIAVFKNTSAAGRMSDQYGALSASTAGIINLYSASASTSPPDLTLSTGNSERVRVVGATGNVGIGGTGSPNSRLTVHGHTGGTSLTLTDDVNSTLNVVHDGVGNITFDGPFASTFRWRTQNVVQLTIAPGGQVFTPGTYAVTGTGSPVHITSSGQLCRSSSSIKYKKDVEALDPALTDKAIRELRPVWYRTKNPTGDDKAEWSHIGLIAEEVAKVEKRLVKYKTAEVSSDDDGNPVVTPLETSEPEDVDYARLSVLLLDHVQRLEKRIAVLEARP